VGELVVVGVVVGVVVLVGVVVGVVVIVGVGLGDNPGVRVGVCVIVGVGVGVGPLHGILSNISHPLASTNFNNISGAVSNIGGIIVV
jgi:hypothetical protein